MRIKRFTFSLVFFSMFALPLNGALGKTIKIAIAGPHSGANAAFGEQLWRGAQQAIKDINAAGGVMGQTLESVKADDACEPKQARTLANRLVAKDKIAAVVGHFCSSTSITASEVYFENDILMMTPASTNPRVTDRGLTTVFRMCGRDDQQGSVASEFIAETLKAKKVAIVHDKTTYGQGLADATKAGLIKKGVQAVLYEGITRGEKDFNTLVTKIKGAKADAVYFGGVHSEAGLLVKQLRDQGLGNKAVAFVSGDGIVSQDFITAAGGKKYAEGVYVTFGADPTRLPTSKKVVETFKKQGYDPEGYTLYSYATVQAIVAAINGAQSTNGTKLAKWLAKNRVSTVMGEKAWSQQGDLVKSDYVIYRWNQDGQYREFSVAKKGS